MMLDNSHCDLCITVWVPPLHPSCMSGLELPVYMWGYDCSLPQSLAGVDWVVKDKLLLETVLGLELYDPVDRCLLYTGNYCIMYS